MAAYIDEHRSRFRVGPICRVLSESLDCGFLTPRGCRMFRTRPVSRMRAGREALARAVLQIRSDFFMAVYGCGKMHAQLVAQGWIRRVGRDRVMNIMRGLGIRGVRRGRTPVTTKPAKGTGGRPDLVDGRFEACAPDTARTWPASPTCAWPTARSAARRSPTACTPVGSWDGRAP